MATALIVLDAQESFRARPEDWATVSAPDIAERVGALAARARTGGHLVVWVLHTEPGTGTVFDPQRGFVELLPGLEAHAEDLTVYKTSFNAFTSTDLDKQLRLRGVDRVVIAGIRTEQCCETTARLAAELGYRVTFVLDATATMPLRRWNSDSTLNAAEVQERTAAALHGRFATVTTTAELVAL